MRAFAILATALVLSCASATGVIDSRTLDCSPGQDVSIEAGFDGELRAERAESYFDLVVRVSNNSHRDVTVGRIRAEQRSPELSRYHVAAAYRQFDQEIEEGKDHTFRLPVTGRPAVSGRALSPARSAAVEMTVTVALSNGDSYRCLFAMQADR